ncbi:MAG: PAS domain-containing protein [Verrucomicrobia bacterium]|nr:PAS domain-containing protein [Verrucomicrobiota bacterium]
MFSEKDFTRTLKKPISPKPEKRRSTPAAAAKSAPHSSPQGKRTAEHACPIVGIGASAGGLEALTQFLEHVPANSGMAFVVVQHLDPTHKGMLPDLLQRATAMKVVQVTDRIRIRPDRVYVIPPNYDLSLLHGTLHLLTPVAPRGLRLPIDSFFRSLAEDQRERSIGVVLSGMGSDGTLGLKAIKEQAGLVLVQEPASAKFDAMPRSAVDAGLADIVAPADQLPEKLITYRRHVPKIGKAEQPLEGKTQGALEKIVILLRSRTGHDFTLYRRSTLHRRVERRMGIHQLARIDDYVRYLQENPQELDILFKELLIGVTAFFRDTPAWKELVKNVLPPLLADRPAGGVLRAWVVGCSTGEEAYSLAMAFVETTKHLKVHNLSLQIYATDLDKDAIDKARHGLFPKTIAAEVSPARLARFFVKEEAGYRVNKEIRSMVVFAPQNLIMDPPFTKLDILSCRNLLIYLTPELQKKLFPLFHYSLNARGVLFLGSAESIGSFSNLFTPLALKERIFQRADAGILSTSVDFPAVFVPGRTDRPDAPRATANPPASLQSLADQLLHARFAPPAVLVNAEGDILYISGRTGKYLEPAAGKANWNVIAMAREGLRYDLTSALQKIHRKKGVITVRGIKGDASPGARSVDIMVQSLEEPKELFGMVLIVFSDSAIPVEIHPAGTGGKPRSRSGAQKHLQLELLRAREEVQAGREEMQTSQEELKSMNEELQSTNEELQSTNEELMTSKEEMQSLNEELQTVNAELQAKLDELSGANNDMKNLLNSTDIATVFLDNDLHVRRFTLQAKTIIKFIASDVGRPITDLASDLLYPTLVADAHEVLRTLVFSERAIASKDGRWFTVRVMPYRTTDNRIDGVVITYADITASKKVEADLRTEHGHLVKQSAVQEAALLRLQPKGKPKSGVGGKSKA